MKFQILTAQHDRIGWDAMIDKLPREMRDVHMTAAYGLVQERLGGTSIAAVMTDGADFVLQSFIINPTPFQSGHFDLVNPYGFGGPVVNRLAPVEDIRRLGRLFREQMRDWCKHAAVVSEYSALHPLLVDQQVHLLHSLPVIWVKPVVVIDLEKFDLATTVRRRVRRGIKTAQAAGMVFSGGKSHDVACFASLYDVAMRAKSADKRWLLDFDYFNAHGGGVDARWFYVGRGYKEHRALLTIGAADTAYAHFLGSDGSNKDLGLDELMYYEAALALKASGYERFHLGGGLTSSLTDSLLAFKSGFADPRHMTANYGVIHDRDAYSALLDKKTAAEIEMFGRESEVTSWFPLYRREFT